MEAWIDVTDIDVQIIPLAQRQHSLFTVGQVVAGGGTRRQIEYRLEKGLWERRSRIVLSLANAPRSFEQTAMAAHLHADWAIPSHRAAARLQNVPNVPAPFVEVTDRYGRSGRNPFAVVHRSADLMSEDIVMVGLLPLTSLARTAADLFTCLSPARATWVAEGLLGAGRLSLAELEAVHERYARRGRPATVAVRRLLARLDEQPPPKSELERRALRLLAAADLPEPERQVSLPGWVEHPAHVDFAYARQRLIIEVDGRSWHSRTSEFELDRRRDNAAQLAGWVVLRFTWRQVTQDPDYVVATISAALRRVAA